VNEFTNESKGMWWEIVTKASKGEGDRKSKEEAMLIDQGFGTN